jgi:hypothetical protein
LCQQNQKSGFYQDSSVWAISLYSFSSVLISGSTPPPSITFSSVFGFKFLFRRIGNFPYTAIGTTVRIVERLECSDRKAYRILP